MPFPIACLSAVHNQRNGQNAATAWTPALPTTDGGVSPEHWYRSDDAYQDAARTTPVASDGDVVGNLTDKAVSADHVSQATTGNKPTWQNGAGDQLNGHPVIEFDGIDDWLRGAFTTGGALAQPFTVFVVAKLDVAATGDGASHAIGDSDDSTNRMKMDQSSGNVWDIYAGVGLSGGASDSNWNIWLARFNGVTSTLWMNGILEAGPGNAGAHNPDGLTIGADRLGFSPWNGVFVERVTYDSDLSNADKNEVGTYLATRYGLSWTTIS